MRFLRCRVFLLVSATWAVAACPELPQNIDKSEAISPLEPDKTEKCPVCGMFVAKYPDWTARVVFANGDIIYFDGAKDMFKFLLDLQKHLPGAAPDDLAGIHVTEYYRLKPIDARSAYYVIGSDILGPMGRELIPLASCEDAETFLHDHQGLRILLFQDVTASLLKTLD